ncbi:MAG TPA: hypothetical protein VFR86_19960 [Burkholderiaceae bacterium]|nr:hypothetical protein [Burkholderiaceae bacterium]
MRLFLVFSFCLLQGCIVVPRTVETYDPACRIVAREMLLDVVQVGGFAHCHGEGCATLLVAMGVVTATSAVVSGSIAVVGNIVYWFERRGQCRAADMGSPG